MANEEHVARLREGVGKWNEWRASSHGWPDLSGADLRDADLTAANLFHANLRAANLSGVSLRAAILSWASLSRASLREGNLRFATLDRTDIGVADLSGATVGWTIFANLDLSAAKGLGAVVHAGPSTVGIDTLYRSGGRIPESFLRGAGVPDNLIAYAGSLIGKPIEFYSCFISYSTKDQTFAERLYADLQAKGVRCWFAPHDMSGGRKIHEQIDEAIRLYDRLLLILSRDSMESEWVKTEIAKARKREVREKRRMLFPVRLVDFETLQDWECPDGDTGKDEAREIREYFVPDFSQWKDHDSYRAAFERLVRDLTSETSG